MVDMGDIRDDMHTFVLLEVEEVVKKRKPSRANEVGVICMALPAIINNPFALIVSKQKIANNFAWELNISSLPQDPLYLSRRVRRWLFACSLEYLDLCVVGVAERLQQLSK